jgi:hypothetical protein
VTDYKVCRFRELIVGDQFLDPVSGALARVDTIERKPQRSGPEQITIAMTMMVSKGKASLTLRHDRPMRRKFREGEKRE